jgi:hypothetical protein
MPRAEFVFHGFSAYPRRWCWRASTISAKKALPLARSSIKQIARLVRISPVLSSGGRVFVARRPIILYDRSWPRVSQRRFGRPELATDAQKIAPFINLPYPRHLARPPAPAYSESLT